MESSPFSREVQAFISASEAILSPVSRGQSLTPEECDIIAYYVMMLSSAKQPWAKELTVRYA
jgi:hypothetical protein